MLLFARAMHKTLERLTSRWADIKPRSKGVCCSNTAITSFSFWHLCLLHHGSSTRTPPGTRPRGQGAYGSGGMHRTNDSRYNFRCCETLCQMQNTVNDGS